MYLYFSSLLQCPSLILQNHLWLILNGSGFYLSFVLTAFYISILRAHGNTTGGFFYCYCFYVKLACFSLYIARGWAEFGPAALGRVVNVLFLTGSFSLWSGFPPLTHQNDRNFVKWLLTNLWHFLLCLVTSQDASFLQNRDLPWIAIQPSNTPSPNLKLKKKSWNVRNAISNPTSQMEEPWKTILIWENMKTNVEK